LGRVSKYPEEFRRQAASLVVDGGRGHRAGRGRGRAGAAGRPATRSPARSADGPPDDEQVLLRLVGLTLLVAGLAQSLGASATVGAFLVGLALPASFADRARAILGPLRDLFAATFFVAFGLHRPDRGPAGAARGAAAGAGHRHDEGATGWYAARRDGIAVPGRLRAGTALIARGQFSIVIAGLAVASGVTDIGTLAARYVLVLAVAGPVTRFARPATLRAPGDRHPQYSTCPPAGVKEGLAPRRGPPQPAGGSPGPPAR
jgi:Kef-type K+ transport system membrane component KefB